MSELESAEEIMKSCNGRVISPTHKAARKLVIQELFEQVTKDSNMRNRVLSTKEIGDLLGKIQVKSL